MLGLAGLSRPAFVVNDGVAGAAPSARRHRGIGFAVRVSFCTALDRREPAATGRPARGTDQAPVAAEATCRTRIGADHTVLGAEPGGPPAGDGVEPEIGRHLGIAGLGEGGEVIAAGNYHSAAAQQPPRLPDGANHQLPPDILTEDGEAEPNRPTEQRLLGIEAGTWAADEPPRKNAGTAR